MRKQSPSRKKHPVSTVSSEQKAERVRSRQRAAHTSAKLRAFAISALEMPSALQQGNDPVTPTQLAAELGVEPIRLLPLIEHGYLKVHQVSPVLVIRPLPAAMEWLSMMFRPLPMRPVLPTHMAAEMFGMDEIGFRQLCVAYNIHLYSDPAFGEHISVVGFHAFYRALHHFREPSRFDRAGLLNILWSALPSKNRAPRHLPFDKRLDEEIRRIALLPEPLRTEQAVLLWEAYSDAVAVSDAVAQTEGVEPTEIRCMDRVKKMVEASVGSVATSARPDSES